MGQEQSSLIDPDTPPDTLSERSLHAVAEFIKKGGVKRIVVMTGAGISTAAGIPDFRSPKTGLYHNLSRFNLPHPEAVFEIDFFRRNPAPFYLLAKELYPGNFSPTISHAFIALLSKKGLLRMLFTQNIDCLERAAGVPADKIVEAHGSFATQRCIDCRTEFPDHMMHDFVKRGEAPRCVREVCKGLVKPDIVFFGEQLPEKFHNNTNVTATADLVLVMGTSLLVHPFAGLPRNARERVPRVLFNLERVGDLGTRADDVLVLGECDAGVRKLADELGWRDELEGMWRKMVGDKEADRQISKTAKEAAIEDELAQLVQDVEDKLAITTDTEGDRAEANVDTQDDGGARGKEILEKADAQKLVDDGVPVSETGDGEGGEEGVGQEGKGKGEVGDGGKEEQLTFEPLKPTTLKPVTAEGAGKAEDQGGGDKPAV
ncbi:NAD-dependent deacetylase sirtuin-2 [Annulohypoxylon maeteangense]|uniref:NAD-dependent deacetylase sirtuin-2 n=1 Tax=Annulohypoxylon maeteangense TaxID=1927788 RepID=UPI0020083BB6|nr:NAD-dependent deacetylase sirtuin-2 [Annulohypoxylon maeteangense]KAI0883904.1 NAD-dependent deacetylase sirtuin-2 [Annulohypoxylon maeteangense]